MNKNKYLQIKNQNGGNNIDFPQQVLNKLVENGCFQKKKFTIDTVNYATINNFFDIITKTNKNNFYPDTSINENIFVGKTSFVKEDITKIWSRLDQNIEENIDQNTKFKLMGLTYRVNKNNYVNIDDFINIEDNKIFINGIEYKYPGLEKYNILYEVTKKIKNKNSDNSIDSLQLSGLADPFAWNIYSDATKDFNEFIETVFGTKSIHGQFSECEFSNNNTIYYQHCGNFVIFYKSQLNSFDIYFKICYVEQSGETLKLFPFGLKNILLNEKFEKSIIYLFNQIKDNLESIYKINLDQNQKIYESLNGEYYNDFQKLFNNNLMQKTEVGKKSRADLRDYIKNIDFDDEFYNINDSKTYDKFNELGNSYQPNEYYKILPDGFFHIHVVNANDKYMLLTCHADIEITSTKIIKYTYTDKYGDKHNQIRKTIPDPKEKQMFNQVIKNHNFYILFNKQSNEHYIYNIRILNNSCLDSVFFISDKTIGITENLFNNQICDINYITNYGVIINRQNASCKFFCKNTNDVNNMTFENIYNLDSKCNGLKCGTNIFYKNKYFYLTDKKMKCASAKLIDDNKTLFIDDILVNWQFKNYDKEKLKPTQILKEFVKFAKENNLTKIELVDNAFLQIPINYYDSIYSKFKYLLIYLYKDPSKPSIYSSKFNLINKQNSKSWYTSLISHLILIVNEYKTKNTTYNLYNEAMELLKLKLNKEDISNERSYNNFKNEYNKFDTFITDELYNFIQKNITYFLTDVDLRSNIFELYTKKNNFFDFTKLLLMDKFYIDNSDFDKYSKSLIISINS